MHRTVVLNVVGLTPSLLGPRMPQLTAFRDRGAQAFIQPAFPAVTCTAQSNYLTGVLPARHGIVGNGWYDRDLAEVQFWKQSNHLVRAPKVWEGLRQVCPGFTCAKLFWWHNMYSGADYSLTPRPMYPADGRKFFDVYSHPDTLRPAIKKDLGEFPFPCFWGPAAGTESPAGPPDGVSRWIAASARWVEERWEPGLNLVYLPHLDYNLQRLGPDHPEIGRDLARVDAITGDLIRFFEARGVRVLVVSEYGIEPVRTPVHLNRLLRGKGWLAVREELGRELLDAGASRVFAVADHQVAHVYANDPSLLGAARALLENTPGVAEVLGGESRAARGLDHARAGDLVAVAAPGAWFTYYYWLEEARAPDFARTVDIHRKPGYDPVELFLDSSLRAVKLRIAWRLLQKKLGFRMLMDVIPLDASLVRGSHGRPGTDPQHGPVCLSGVRGLLPERVVDSTAVCGLIRRHVLE